MSGQSLIMFVCVVAIAVAADKAQDVSWNTAAASKSSSVAPDFERATRGPASTTVSSSKKDILHSVEKPVHKHTQKLRGPMGASIELVGTPPAQSGDVFVLKGVVVSEEAVKDAQFRWLIPAGVEVVSGSVRSTIAFLTPDQPFETQIVLRQVSPENARVHFKLRARGNGMKFGDSAQYNTFMQAALQASKQDLKKSTLEHAKEEKKKLKIMH